MKLPPSMLGVSVTLIFFSEERNGDDGDGLDIPRAWIKFASAGAVWPPVADGDPDDQAMGCLLNLLKMHSMKTLSGKTLEANVLMWKSLRDPWVDTMPVKAQSIRKHVIS